MIIFISLNTFFKRRKNLNESFRIKFGDISYHTKMSQLASSNTDELKELKSIDQTVEDGEYRSEMYYIDQLLNYRYVSLETSRALKI